MKVFFYHCTEDVPFRDIYHYNLAPSEQVILISNHQKYTKDFQSQIHLFKEIIGKVKQDKKIFAPVAVKDLILEWFKKQYKELILQQNEDFVDYSVDSLRYKFNEIYGADELNNFFRQKVQIMEIWEGVLKEELQTEKNEELNKISDEDVFKQAETKTSIFSPFGVAIIVIILAVVITLLPTPKKTNTVNSNSGTTPDTVNSNSGTTPNTVNSNSGTTPDTVNSNSGTTPDTVNSNSGTTPDTANSDQQDQENLKHLDSHYKNGIQAIRNEYYVTKPVEGKQEENEVDSALWYIKEMWNISLNGPKAREYRLSKTNEILLQIPDKYLKRCRRTDVFLERIRKIFDFVCDKNYKELDVVKHKLNDAVRQELNETKCPLSCPLYKEQ